MFPPCESKDCGRQAELTVFWPAQTLRMCRPCAARAIGAAAAMGFTLEVRPVMFPSVVPLTTAQKAILVSVARTRWGVGAALSLHLLLFPDEPLCPDCGGAGHENLRRCRTCDGLGYITLTSVDREVR